MGQFWSSTSVVSASHHIAPPAADDDDGDGTNIDNDIVQLEPRHAHPLPVPVHDSGPPMPPAGGARLTREERDRAKEKLQQLHDMYLDTPGLDLMLRRIHELIRDTGRPLLWDPILLHNIQHLARELLPRDDSQPNNHDAQDDGPYDMDMADAPQVGEAGQPGPAYNPVVERAESDSDQDSVQYGNVQAATPPYDLASRRSTPGDWPVIDPGGEDSESGEPIESIETAAPTSGNERRVVVLPGSDLDDKELASRQPSHTASSDQSEPAPVPSTTPRSHTDTSAGAQFWRKMVQLRNADQLELHPALKELLDDKTTPIITDSYTIAHDLFNARNAEENGMVCHQDVQIMAHLEARALQDRFRQILGYIHIWYVQSSTPGHWDWRAAAAAPLRHRTGQVEELFKWLQPHLPGSADSHKGPALTPKKSTRREPAQTGLDTPPSTTRSRDRLRAMPGSCRISAPSKESTSSKAPSIRKRPDTNMTYPKFVQFHKFAVRAGKNYAWIASQLSFGALAHLTPLFVSHDDVVHKMTKSDGKAGKGAQWAMNAMNRLRELGIVELADASGADRNCEAVLQDLRQRYYGHDMEHRQSRVASGLVAFPGFEVDQSTRVEGEDVEEDELEDMES